MPQSAVTALLSGSTRSRAAAVNATRQVKALTEDNKALKKEAAALKNKEAQATRRAEELSQRVREMRLEDEGKRESRKQMESRYRRNTFENLIAIVRRDETAYLSTESVALCLESVYHWTAGEMSGPLYVPTVIGQEPRQIWPEGSHSSCRNLDALRKIPAENALEKLSEANAASVARSVISSDAGDVSHRSGGGSPVVMPRSAFSSQRQSEQQDRRARRRYHERGEDLTADIPEPILLN